MARMNATTGPKVVVAGPARLLHVDVHGERGFTIYAVARQTGTDADCLAAGGRARLSVARASRRRPLDLDVPAGQVICLANAADATDGAAPRCGGTRGAARPSRVCSTPTITDRSTTALGTVANRMRISSASWLLAIGHRWSDGLRERPRRGIPAGGIHGQHAAQHLGRRLRQRADARQVLGRRPGGCLVEDLARAAAPVERLAGEQVEHHQPQREQIRAAGRPRSPRACSGDM